MGIRVKRVAKKDLEDMIEDMRIEGYKLKNQGTNTALMEKKGDWGSGGIHLIVFFLTVWFTFGIGNLIYALYSYYSKKETVEIKVKK